MPLLFYCCAFRLPLPKTLRPRSYCADAQSTHPQGCPHKGGHRYRFASALLSRYAPLWGNTFSPPLFVAPWGWKSLPRHRTDMGSLSVLGCRPLYLFLRLLVRGFAACRNPRLGLGAPVPPSPCRRGSPPPLLLPPAPIVAPPPRRSGARGSGVRRAVARRAFFSAAAQMGKGGLGAVPPGRAAKNSRSPSRSRLIAAPAPAFSPLRSRFVFFMSFGVFQIKSIGVTML